MAVLVTTALRAKFSKKILFFFSFLRFFVFFFDFGANFAKIGKHVGGNVRCGRFWAAFCLRVALALSEALCGFLGLSGALWGSLGESVRAPSLLGRGVPRLPKVAETSPETLAGSLS